MLEGYGFPTQSALALWLVRVVLGPGVGVIICGREFWLEVVF